MSVTSTRDARYVLTTSCEIAALVLAIAPPALAQSGEPEDDEIVVTGSDVTRYQGRLSSPVEALDAGEIADTGRVGIDDFLALNTANTISLGGVQDLADGGIDNRAARAANLGGLGPSSTRLFLSGRRMASVAQDNQRNIYTNLTAMTPSIAASRVQPMLDGASAFHDSDAIAGVINLNTDSNYSAIALTDQ